MPTLWDFRKILGVEPETNNLCVGYACSKGRGCWNSVGSKSCERAAQLLNDMNRKKKVPGNDFEALAKVLLCSCRHNCKTWPSSNQVDEVSRKWEDLFEIYKKKVVRKQSTARKLPTARPIPEILQATKITHSKKGNKVQKMSDQDILSVDKINEAPPPPTTIFRPEQKEKNPFVDDEDARPTSPTAFETILRVAPEIATRNTSQVSQDDQHRMAIETANKVVGTLSINGRRPSSVEISPPNTSEKHESSNTKEAASELPLQSSDFPSPPNTPPTATSSKQGTAELEIPEVSATENVSQMTQPQFTASTEVLQDCFIRTPANGARLVFGAGARESSALSPEVFNFNTISWKSGAKWPWTRPNIRKMDSSSRPKSTLSPTVSTNFAAEFGATDLDIQPFDFALPAEVGKERASSDESDTPSKAEQLSKSDAGKVPARPSSDVPDQSIDPVSSSLSADTSHPKIARTFSPFKSQAPSTRRSTTTTNQDTIQAIAPVSSTEHSSYGLSIDTSTQQSETTPTPPITSNTSRPLPSIEISSQETSSTPTSTPTSGTPNTLALQKLSDQKPLPPFDFGFIPRSPNLRPRSRGLSAARSKSPVRLVGNASKFVFGSEYKEPPMTFDFDKWSQVSSKARFPDKLSIRHGLIPERESKSPESFADEVVEKPEAKHLQQEMDEIASDVKPSIETAPVTARNGPLTQIEELESSTETPATPTKASRIVQNDGLLTPDATPESARFSFHTGERNANLEADFQLSNKQDQEGRAPVNENLDIEQVPSPAKPVTDSPTPPARQESFGIAVIEPPTLVKKTHIESKRSDPLLTPPTSPEAPRKADNLELELPKLNLRRSSAVRRKPLPRPELEKPTESEVVLCEECGQTAQTGGETCHCEDQAQQQPVIQGESKQTGGIRGRRRKLQHRAMNGLVAGVAKVGKGLTKVADSMKSRLESVGVDQVSA